MSQGGGCVHVGPSTPPSNPGCCCVLGDPYHYGSTCRYFFYPNAVPGTVEDKTNILLNLIVGPSTTSELIAYVAGDPNVNCMINSDIYSPDPPGPWSWDITYQPWSLAYLLVFPPVIQTIYTMRAGATGTPTYEGGNPTLIPEGQYHTILNPYYSHASNLAGVLFGATLQFSMPCLKTISVPYSMQITRTSDPGDPNRSYVPLITFQTITNPNFDQCFQAMTRQLTTKQTIGNTQVCVGGDAVNKIYLPGTTGYSPSTVQHFISLDAINANYQSIHSSVIGNFLTNADNFGIFFTPTQVGPYDTTTQAPCVDATSSTCTYQMCMQIPPSGYNCNDVGACLPVYGGYGRFPTKADCEACNDNGTCPSGFHCCPESQPNGGTCPTPTPGSSPTTDIRTELFVIGGAVLILIIFFIFYRSGRT